MSLQAPSAVIASVMSDDSIEMSGGSINDE
jgi:hypothetical protein